MGNWTNRAKKLHNRRENKSFSKPFKKKGLDPRKGEKIKIREAQRSKYRHLDNENED